jgi:hypothetical protein
MAGSQGIAGIRTWARLGRALFLLVGLAALPAASVACTPPRPFDLSLTLTATVDGGGALVPGSRGRLVFTAWVLGASRRGPEKFEVHQPLFTPLNPPGPPIRLTAAPGADCAVEERPGPDNGLLGRFQTVVAPRDPRALWPRSCHVDFEVLPAAVAGEAVRYMVRPYDPCGADFNLDNNYADIVFGTIPPPATPARPAPMAAWSVLLLVVAMLAAARIAGRRRLLPDAD